MINLMQQKRDLLLKTTCYLIKSDCFSDKTAQKTTQNAAYKRSYERNSNGFACVSDFSSAEIQCRQIKYRFTASHYDGGAPCNITVRSVCSINVVEQCKRSACGKRSYEHKSYKFGRDSRPFKKGGNAVCDDLAQSAFFQHVYKYKHCGKIRKQRNAQRQSAFTPFNETVVHVDTSERPYQDGHY